MPNVELEGFEITAALTVMCWIGFSAVGAVEWSGSCACPGAHSLYIVGLIRGSILVLLLDVVLLLFLCCAWGHFDDSHGDTAGLAGAQGIAAVSVLLEPQFEFESREL